MTTILRVIFPHDDKHGNRYNPGDLREVADNEVESYTAPDIVFGTPLMAIDPTIDQELCKGSDLLTVFEAPPVDEDAEDLFARMKAQADAELANQQQMLANARADADKRAAAELASDAELLAAAQAKADAAAAYEAQVAAEKAAADAQAKVDADKAATDAQAATDAAAAKAAKATK